MGLPEQEAFDIEYWLLEEAKLQRLPKPKSLAGRVALITGGGGGIGMVTLRAAWCSLMERELSYPGGYRAMFIGCRFSGSREYARAGCGGGAGSPSVSGGGRREPDSSGIGTTPGRRAPGTGGGKGAGASHGRGEKKPRPRTTSRLCSAKDSLQSRQSW